MESCQKMLSEEAKKALEILNRQELHRKQEKLQKPILLALHGINWLPETICVLLALQQEYCDLLEPALHNQVAHQALESHAKTCIKDGFDYMLIVDSDTTFIPPGSVERLLKADKDVICAHAFMRGAGFAPAIIKKRPGSSARGDELFAGNDADYVWPQQGLQKVWLAPFQMMLIKRTTLERLEKPAQFSDPRMNNDKKYTIPRFPYHAYTGNDWPFCQYLEDNNIELWCDTDLEVDHRNVNKRTFQLYKQLASELYTQHTELMTL